MKVILLSDIEKLGRKEDTVEVSNSYGRNSLLNENLMVVATRKSIEILDEQNLQHDLGEKQKEADTGGLKERLVKVTLEFHMKTGEGGYVFGSVSTKQIVAQLHETYGVHVDEREVIDNDATAFLGYTDAEVDFYRNKVIGTIHIHVSGQEAL